MTKTVPIIGLSGNVVAPGATTWDDDGYLLGMDGKRVIFWGLPVRLDGYADDVIEVEGRDVEHKALPQEIEP